MNKRTKTGINSMQERTDRLKFEKDLNILKRLAIDVQDLTNGEIKEVNFKKVCAWLSAKTGFPSAEASANLLGKPEEYQRLKKEHKTSNKYIVFDGENYKPMDNVFALIREDNTSYLSEENQKVFNKMLKVAEVMNKAGKDINCIERLTTGEHVVNPQKIANKGYAM